MDEIKEKLIQDLTPNVLSMEMIEKEKLVAENLFEVKIESKILGPFSGLFLKTFLAGKDVDHMMVKSLESIIWIPIQHHAFFFSGELKPTSSVEPERREFYLLVNGRKIGPYKTEDIEYKFKSGELLFTDLISEDEGNHWCKIYEMPHVDLSRHVGTELPATPTKIENLPNMAPGIQEQIGLVGDLAKAGIEGEKEKSKRFDYMDLGKTTATRPIFSKNTKIFLLIALVILGFYFISGKDLLEKDIASYPEKKETPASKVTPLKKIDQNLSPRKPTSRQATPRNFERKEIIRPPRYPSTQPQDSVTSEPEPLFQDEILPDAEDEILDEEAIKPQRTPSSRRRSKPKPVDDMVEEPIEDYLDQ
jgi:hypothetical protein